MVSALKLASLLDLWELDTNVWTVAARSSPRNGTVCQSFRLSNSENKQPLRLVSISIA